MLKSLFAPLAMKVAGGLALLSMAASLFLYISLLGEQRHSAKLETRAVAAEKEVETLQASIAQLEADSEAREDRVRRAQSQSEAELSKARQRADRVRNTPANGCPTPEAILAADL